MFFRFGYDFIALGIRRKMGYMESEMQVSRMILMNTCYFDESGIL